MQTAFFVALFRQQTRERLFTVLEHVVPDVLPFLHLNGQTPMQVRGLHFSQAGLVHVAARLALVIANLQAGPLCARCRPAAAAALRTAAPSLARACSTANA